LLQERQNTARLCGSGNNLIALFRYAKKPTSVEFFDTTARIQAYCVAANCNEPRWSETLVETTVVQFPARDIDLESSGASQRKQADISDRISQLERLVVVLMNSRNDTGQSNVLPESSTAVLPRPLEDRNQIDTEASDSVGRIVLDKSTTSYVENIHWSAILDGVWQYVTQSCHGF
jgi:hypothetical protein